MPRCNSTQGLLIYIGMEDERHKAMGKEERSHLLILEALLVLLSVYSGI